MKSHIEINGKRYDAITGKAVEAPATMKPHHHLDSIVAPTHKSRAGGTAKPATPPRAADKPTHHHRPSMQDVRQPVTRQRPHTPQPTRTLMRHAVQKPQTAHHTSRGVKAQGEISGVTKHLSLELAPKLSAAVVDNQRLKHARVVPKSKLISHYHPAAGGVVPVAAPTPAAVQPTIQFSPQTPTPTTRQPQTTAELLQHAIDQATSHQQPAPRVRRSYRHSRGRRIASVSTLALVSLTLFGFVLHQNMPSLKLDLASSRAGFAANMPASRPAGFSLNGLDAATGQVALHFQSNSNDGRTYTITEKPSNWDSATLRDSFVVTASNNKYETVSVAGRTLYLYGQQNITWVNGGIWYQVASAGALSNQQLVNIATSL